jgi:hypothetical protein
VSSILATWRGLLLTAANDTGICLQTKSTHSSARIFRHHLTGLVGCLSTLREIISRRLPQNEAGGRDGPKSIKVLRCPRYQKIEVKGKVSTFAYSTRIKASIKFSLGSSQVLSDGPSTHEAYSEVCAT